MLGSLLSHRARRLASQVGVLTMAGKTPRVLVTPTPDLGKVLPSQSGSDVRLLLSAQS